MTETAKAVNEYKRIMTSVNISDAARDRIITACLEVNSPTVIKAVPKPAIAAISGAAVIAAAVGIRKIYTFRNRP